MRKVALRGLFARKLRLVLTALAVALGVTLIAGTYVFTDTINTVVRQDLHRSRRRAPTRRSRRARRSTRPNRRRHAADGVAGRARARSAGSPASRAPTARSSTSAPCSARTASASARAAPRTSSPRSPSRRASTLHGQARAASPRTADEVAIDASTANSRTSSSATRSPSSATAPRKDYTIVGTTQIAGVDSFGGATVVDMLLPEAQRMLGKAGFDQIEVAAKPGVTPEQLRDQSRAALPRDGQRAHRPGGGAQAVRRHQGRPELPDDRAAGVRRHLAVRRRVHHLQHLLDHGHAADARVRAAADARRLARPGDALGRRRGPDDRPARVVRRPRCSAWRWPAGLRALFRAVGVDLPSNGNVIATRTIIVSLAVGTLVTVLSSLAPALRATRVPPVEALHEGAVPPSRGPSRKVTVAGTLLGVLGVGLMAARAVRLVLLERGAQLRGRRRRS